GQFACAAQVVEQFVAFGIDVRCRFVRDLPGRAAQADALVENRCADPHGPAILIALLGLPEADVMTMPGIVTDGLLEGQVLLAAKEELAAHRCVIVFALEDTSFCNLQRAS